MTKGQIKLHSILPMWMLIYMSPFLFVFLTISLLIDSFLIYMLLKYYDIKMKKEVFLRTITMAWILGFSADIISLVFLQLIGRIFKDIDYYYIFSNGISISAHLIAIMLSAILTFFLTRFLFTRVTISKKIAFHMAIIMSILSSPWMFIVPTNTLY